MVEEWTKLSMQNLEQEFDKLASDKQYTLRVKAACELLTEQLQPQTHYEAIHARFANLQMVRSADFAQNKLI